MKTSWKQIMNDGHESYSSVKRMKLIYLYSHILKKTIVKFDRIYDILE